MLAKYSLLTILLLFSCTTQIFCSEHVRNIIAQQKQLVESIKLPQAIQALTQPRVDEADRYAYFIKKGEEVADLFVKYLLQTPNQELNLRAVQEQAALECCIWSNLSGLCRSTNPESKEHAYALKAFTSYARAFCNKLEAIKAENTNFAQVLEKFGWPLPLCSMVNAHSRQVFSIQLRFYRQAAAIQKATTIDQIYIDLKQELQNATAVHDREWQSAVAKFAK